MSTWDLAVVGGGPAGAVAAWVAARSGLRVALFDDGGRALPQLGESLPAATRSVLRAVDLEDALQGHLPCYGNAAAWGSAEIETMDAIRDPSGHGWHLDRERFDAFLHGRAVGVGARPIAKRITGAREVAGGIALDAADRSYVARYVIDATGRRATVARQLGSQRTRDDGLVALCAWTRTPSPVDDSRTLLETCPAGWWYTAALPDGTRSVVLHTDSELAGRLSDPKRWRALLRTTNHIQRLIGPTGAPRGAEACGARLDRFAGRRWLAVGDAACSFDPVSSQGVFFALYSGMRAAQAVQDAATREPGALRRYCARVERVRAAYQSRHRFAYAAETRWPQSPFWSSRSGGADLRRS